MTSSLSIPIVSTSLPPAPPSGCLSVTPKSLNEIEQEDLAMFCQASSTLKRTYDLVQDFMQMVRKRAGHRLDAWLERVANSDLAELQQFAAGVEKVKPPSKRA
jgi:Transposase